MKKGNRDNKGKHQSGNFPSYSQAKKIIQSYNLKSRREWHTLRKSSDYPAALPKSPADVYRNKGWEGWGDFLGTGTIQPQKIHFRTFDEARKFARSLKLTGQVEWSNYCKSGEKPNDIPNWPTYVYRNKGWEGWGDWVGSDNIHPSKRQYRSFSEARKFARSLGFKKREEWLKFYRAGNLPIDIPSGPQQSYSDKGWKGWGNWLGSGNIHPKYRKFRSFEDARKFVRKLKFKGGNDWREYYKSGQKPDDIPTNPDTYYKNKGWIDFGDWLGTGTISVNKREWRPFEEAREFVRSLGLKTQDAWNEYGKSGKRPDDIPSDAARVYKKEWKDLGDWLGTGSIAKQVKASRYLPFDEAKKEYQRLAKQYGLNGRNDWRRFAKTHEKLLDDLRIPMQPWKAYSKERIVNGMIK